MGQELETTDSNTDATSSGSRAKGQGLIGDISDTETLRRWWRQMAKRQRVLFVCTHNSARSQIAEGLLRALAGSRYEVHSAGTVATKIRPEAVRVMREIGIDISQQESKTLDRYLKQDFDWVITVCDEAAETCPVFPGHGRRLHWSLPDPSEAKGTDEERLAEFRGVRDRLRRGVEQFMAEGP